MGRLKWIPVVLVVALLVAAVGVHEVSVGAVADGLVKDLEAGRRRTIERSPPPQSPRHEDGFVCLRSMLGVSPTDLSPFLRKAGEPAVELTDEVRARLKALSPWATAMRACASSRHLTFGAGAAPEDREAVTEWLRLIGATRALFEFTRVELQVLIADAQPEVALERCSEAWAFAADLSHLGLMEAMLARAHIRSLAPSCGAALAASPPDVKAQVAKTWATLPARLTSGPELIATERKMMGLLYFGWTKGVPHATPAADPTFLRKLTLQRQWISWDRAMRKLEAVANTPGPARVAAAASIDTIHHAWPMSSEFGPDADYEKFLRRNDESNEVLTLMLALALDDASDRPHVTRAQGTVTYTGAQGEPLVIPTVKP